MSQSRPPYGKAGQLRALADAGFSVPRFFVVTRAELEGADPRGMISKGIADSATGRTEYFAVRSSATGEDGTKASMAGAFHSELGVPRVAVVDASKRVLVSYGSSSPEDIVIVQEFIASDAGGVMFTDAGDGSIIINANAGLCETVVKGLPCDEFTLDPSGAITERIIVDSKKARFFSNGTFSDRTVSHPSLTDGQIRDLFLLGIEVEKLLGAPQDIEWCLSGPEIFLLQSRPVTRAVRHEETFFDSANIAESYSGVVSPLTYSFAREMYRSVYRYLLLASGVAQKDIDAHPEIFDELLAQHCGRMFYNMNNWYRMMSFLPGYERNKRNLEGMITSSVRSSVRRSVRPPLRLRLLYLPLVAWKMLRHRSTVARFERDVRIIIDEAERKLASPLSVSGLKEVYEELQTKLLPKWHVTVENDFLVMTYLGLLKKLVPDESRLLPLLRFPNVSAGQVHELRILGRKVFSLAKSEETFRHKDFEGLWKTLSPDLAPYFQTYGGRFANELKLESPDLHEDHALFFTLLHEYAVLPAAPAAEEHQSPSSPLLRFILRKFRRSAAKREELRLLRSHAFSLVRKIFRTLGTAMHRDGRIAESGDIFFLTVDEAFALAADTSDRQSGMMISAARKKRFAEFATLRTKSHFSVHGDVTDMDIIESAAPEASAPVLRGRGSVTGRVTGRVRLFPEFSLPADPFEILVASHTDPGWAPVIGLARGMIIEHGGLLSHAAIISRELGIPTVIGAAGALAKLQDGQTVTVDGTQGTVTIHP